MKIVGRFLKNFRPSGFWCKPRIKWFCDQIHHENDDIFDRNLGGSYHVCGYGEVWVRKKMLSKNGAKGLLGISWYWHKQWSWLLEIFLTHC